jgi:hypothetical protein
LDAVSSFTDPLILEAMPEELEGRGLFRVHKAFSYDIGYEGSGITVTVPEGFVTDLCSVPAFARPFVPLSGKVAKPALLHDWLLTLGDDDRAHKVFDEALGVAEVKPATRWLLVCAVRLWTWWKGFRNP